MLLSFPVKTLGRLNQMRNSLFNNCDASVVLFRWFTQYYSSMASNKGAVAHACSHHVNECHSLSKCEKTCQEVCSASIPSSLLAKIDYTSELKGTVKPHDCHILCIVPFHGWPASQWPSDFKLSCAEEALLASLLSNAFSTTSPSIIINELDEKILFTKKFMCQLKSHFASSSSSVHPLITLVEHTDLFGMATNESEASLDPFSFHMNCLVFPQGLYFSNILLSCLNEPFRIGHSPFTSLCQTHITTDHSSLPFEFSPCVPIEEERGDKSKIFIIVCAHMSRDKRCGIIGHELITLIDDWIEEQGLSGRVLVLGCSHLGGHKYAGNVVIFPQGVWYGRVLPCQVHDLLSRHILKGEIVQELYRGALNSPHP
jgi:(2Fe-2S) ferredoxin